MRGLLSALLLLVTATVTSAATDGGTLLFKDEPQVSTPHRVQVLIWPEGKPEGKEKFTFNRVTFAGLDECNYGLAMDPEIAVAIQMLAMTWTMRYQTAAEYEASCAPFKPETPA